MFFFRVCGVDRTYVFSLYCNPDLDDWIFDCLLTSMAAVQAEDVHASFPFVGDLNGHHQEWLGSATTNHHGVAVFGLSSSLPPLVGGSGGLVCETVGKADWSRIILMASSPWSLLIFHSLAISH